MTTDLHDLVHAFDPDVPLAAATSPPAAWFVAPEMHALERTAVFRRHWLFACPAEHVAKNGSWTSGRHDGLPWVVVRDESGILRAFQNVCRHRAAEVVRGRGCTPVLECRYHAWRYHLDGRLKSAPRAGALQDFDRDTFSLPPLGVLQWGPLVLIHADPEAAPPPAVEGLDPLLAHRWEGLRWAARKTYDVRCNWKVFADNYLDGGYHIAHMHPSLDAQIDMRGYRTELLPGASVQTAPPTSGDSRATVDVEARIGDGAVYAWVHPTLMINRYGPVLDTNTVVPVGPDRCLVHFDFWFEGDPDTDEARAFVEQSIAQSHVTQLEDIDVSESVQLGTASDGFHRGRYAPAHEIAIHHFHRLLAADLRAALTAERAPSP